MSDDTLLSDRNFFNEAFTLSGLGLFGINLYVVDDVFAGGIDFANGIGTFENDESKVTRTACLWICLDIDGFSSAIFANSFSEVSQLKPPTKSFLSSSQAFVASPFNLISEHKSSSNKAE